MQTQLMLLFRKELLNTVKLVNSFWANSCSSSATWYPITLGVMAVPARFRKRNRRNGGVLWKRPQGWWRKPTVGQSWPNWGQWFHLPQDLDFTWNKRISLPKKLPWLWVYKIKQRSFSVVWTVWVNIFETEVLRAAKPNMNVLKGNTQRNTSQ